MRVAGWVKELGLPLTLNVVLHRANLDRVSEVVAMAERLEADRLELRILVAHLFRPLLRIVVPTVEKVIHAKRAIRLLPAAASSK